MVSYTESIIPIDDYLFRVTVNSANVLAYMQRDLFYSVGTSQAVFLRSFFFDDIQASIIQEFCQQFAHDTHFRDTSLNRSADWAQVNDLFLRNCFNPYYQANPFLEQIGSPMRAYTFFLEHTSSILALPSYQEISQQDNAIIPQAHQPDPRIANSIRLLNQLEGVKTLASCQGVSHVVRYQNYEMMTLSPHARFAYVWFSKLPSYLVNQIDNPHIKIIETVYPAMQSTGDNQAFLKSLHDNLVTIHHHSPPSG